MIHNLILLSFFVAKSFSFIFLAFVDMAKPTNYINFKYKKVVGEKKTSNGETRRM
jgi:hypothetical protein